MEEEKDAKKEKKCVDCDCDGKITGKNQTKKYDTKESLIIIVLMISPPFM